MIRLYQRITRNCKTINQLNRVHIALENRMTPPEVESLWTELAPKTNWSARLAWRWRRTTTKLLRKAGASQAGADFTSDSQKWIVRLHGWLRAAGGAPAAFGRKHLRPGLSLFSGAEPRDQKTLVLGFSGNFDRLMMPISAFLQNLDPAEVDVAYLRSERHTGYTVGIRGVANTIHQSIDELPDILNIGAYRRLAAIGTSGGALASILAGLRLKADAILAIGMISPADPRWTKKLNEQQTGQYLSEAARALEQLPKILLVHGADITADAKHAHETAAFLPGAQVVSIPNCEHNVLFPMLENGTLRTFLRDTLLT